MNRGKRIFAGLVLTVAMILSATGCGEEKTASKPLVEITQSVMESGVEFPEMVEVSEENFQFKYDISADDYSEFSVWWAGSGGDADEICIIKAKDNKLDTVKDAVTKRLDNQKTTFKDYVPAQYDKLCSTEVKTEGNYVYWICTNDNTKVEDTILSYFK